MIRLSKESDRKNIIDLWHEAFGDSQAEIEFFLDNCPKAENTLVYEADGRIVSMLFLLEGEMQIKNKSYPSYYLYAACTLNEYRGRGLMAELLGFAKKTAADRDFYFICLLPADKSLYNYYEKFGYKTVFKKKILKIKRNNACADCFINTEDNIDIDDIRNKAFMPFDMFRWNNQALKFAFVHHKLYGGQSFTNCKGYTLYSVSGYKITVKEFAFTGEFDAIVDYIFSQNARTR